MERTIGSVLAALVLLAPAGVGAETLSGFIVGVLDGETVMFRDEAQKQHRIRLLGVDAPGKREPFGDLARHDLSRMAFQQPARAECPVPEGKARWACQVWVQPPDCPSCGATLDLGLAQVTAGKGRWREADGELQSAEDRGRYRSAQEEAMKRRWGLWGDPR